MSIITFILSLMTAINLNFAQTASLKINSLTIEGSLYEFSAKLENQGFELLDADFAEGSSMFSGEYEGFKESTIVVNADEDGNVKTVTVMVKASEKGVQSAVNELYLPIKEKLRETYGAPALSIEDFSGREKDIRKRLKAGKAATTEFIKSGGVILLSLAHDPLVGGYFAVVVYELRSVN